MAGKYLLAVSSRKDAPLTCADALIGLLHKFEELYGLFCAQLGQFFNG